MHSSVSFAANGSNSVSSAWDAPNRPRVSAARNVPSVRAITSGTVISVNGDRTSLAPRVDLAVGAVLRWPVPILLQATVFSLDLSQASAGSGAIDFARFDSGDTSLPFPPCRETHGK